MANLTTSEVKSLFTYQKSEIDHSHHIQSKDDNDDPSVLWITCLIVGMYSVGEIGQSPEGYEHERSPMKSSEFMTMTFLATRRSAESVS